MKNILIYSLIGFTILSIISCKQKKEKQVENLKTELKEETNAIKLSTIDFGDFGNRYITKIDIGLKKEIPVMIHGNASGYLYITHEIAESLNSGKPITKISDFGYSSKGMGITSVSDLVIGNQTFPKIEKVTVLDWPNKSSYQGPKGMLGLGFLVKENVILNFVTDEMVLGNKISNQPNQKLLDIGYKSSSFIIENNKAIMNVYFEVLGKEIPVIVSTAWVELNLHAPFFKDKVRLTENTSEVVSPSNIVVPIHKTNSIRFGINGVMFDSPALLYDQAKYSNMPESDLKTYAMIGYDWMKKYSAIIDYGNKILYFKKE